MSAPRWLPRTVESPPDRPEVAGPDHPMRKVTHQVAFEATGWDRERARKVGALFDGLAAEWHQRGTAERLDALRDALERGAVAGGRCLELGCGTGHGTRLLAERFDAVVAVDLSREMLRRAAPAGNDLVCADAGRLPFPDACADALVMVNMLLFPAEADRVLAPGGRLVYVSSLGDRTPIYLAPEAVARALPGRWEGVAAEAGWGTWCSLVRRREEEG